MIVILVNNQNERGSLQMNTTTVGVDLAKYLFSICMMDSLGRVLLRREFRREAFAHWLAQLPADTIAAVEACSGAHHWARRCLELGLQPRLIAAQFVKPFRKSQRSKNDRNDAEAIATAARQGNMRFVAIKTVDQQARLSWHRVREGYKDENLRVMNRIRGLLAEFGIVTAKSQTALRRALPQIIERENLPREFVELLQALREHWQLIQTHLHQCDQRIETHADADEHCRRVRALTGVGSLTADAVVASVGDGRDFRHGRQMAAWIGLVPRQNSSGGHQRLGRISCSGDAYLRTVLIQGARSSVLQASRVPPDKATPEQIWINQLATRVPFGKLLVAIANKHARQIWAMLARGEAYDPNAWIRHPMVQRNTRRKNALAVAA
jgi:transposase